MVLISWMWLLIINYVHKTNAYQCFELKNLNTDACGQCEFGAECVLSTKNVTCKCIEKCYSYGDSLDSREVCANDGNTFQSICHLKKYSCELKKDLKVKYIGKCNPCKGVKCLPNQICLVDENRQPICKCDDNCDSTSFQPVCSSDGRTYYNECTLKVESCKQRRDLKILFGGECGEQNDIESCSNANCANYELCNIDLNGRSHCNCSSIDCPPVYLPVCADDANTYDSICHLKKFSCESKKELSILNYRVCSESLNQENQCDNFQCNFGSFCSINSSTLQPFCECEQCSMEYEPVCGSNGRTYLNSCVLRRQSCLDQIEINQLYNGECTGCLSHRCKNYSTCKINQLNQTVECVCAFDCQLNETEVCGSDNRLYPNECELKKRSCETNSELTIIPDLSICQLCKQVFCKFGATCYNGKCICPTDCPKDLYEPVCSFDGRSYYNNNNECEFRKAACSDSRDTKTGNLNYEKLDNHTIHLYGDCNRPNLNEETKLIPIIGKSSILISDHQMIGGYMTMCNENTCKFGGKCYYNENRLPACLCTFDCTGSNEINNKICGSDGRLYLNDCKLMEETCIRQQKIEIFPLKNCLINRNYSICNGTLPSFDRASGKFIDCDKRSLFYKECSTDYTCLYHRKVIPSVRTLLTFKEQDHFCCLKQNIDQIQFASLNELTINSKQIEQQSRCDCNKLGSELPIRCDEKTKQCECKRNVTGLSCNRCSIGYYAFHKLSQGNSGCLPCDCNKNGSLREDCHQTTGLCICKMNVSGMKCDTCENGKKLTSFGCVDEALLKVHNKKCSSIRCRFSAVCKEISSNRSQCVCNLSCRKRFELNYQRRIERNSNYSDAYYLSMLKNFRRISRDKSKYLSRPICASDQNTHLNFLNECEMRITGCRMQRKIVKIKDGQCSSKELNNFESFTRSQSTVTQTPVRRSTLEKEKDFYDLIDETVSIQTESTLNTNLYTNMYEDDRSNFNPLFTGRSLIRLSRLESSSYLKLEIELIAFSEKGIIFYNGQSNEGVGDFISLTLNNGYFEYRFNLGSGVSTLRSREKVQKAIPTKITLIKDSKKGFLIVNDQEEVACVAEGNWRSLDLNENFFLGYIKSEYEKIYENLNNIKTGFVGCLMKLELGKNDKELKSIELINSNEINKATTSVLNEDVNKQSKMKILELESIGNCSSINKNSINFCLKYNPCSKHSVCVNLINNTFDCICPVIEKCMVGFTSSKSDNSKTKLDQPPDSASANVYTLDFWGESYIKSKVLLVNLARAFSIELWFLSRNPHGLLIYAQKSRKSDFLSLNLKESKLEFIFNLGSKIPNISGVVKIKSNESITLNYWHKVRIARLDDYATMQIDNGFVYSDQAKGNLSELNLDEPVYIGGHDNFSESNQAANLTNCLNGAIQRIILNGEIFIGSNLLRSSERSSISSYLGPPCEDLNKCEGKGECIPMLNEFECKII